LGAAIPPLNHIFASESSPGLLPKQCARLAVMLAFGCCVSSEAKVAAWVRPFVGDRPCVEVTGSISLTRSYNYILNNYVGEPYDAVVLLHDDLEVTDPDAEAKILYALDDPDVGLVGVAGGEARNGLAWWSANPVGHQMIDTGLIDFGVRAGQVKSIEGSFMVFSPRAVDKLRFDERYTGFHGYDDIGLEAGSQGFKVVVIDLDTHHHTVAGFKTPESEQAWVQADQMFREKWGL